jgi:hypothetical protein
MSEMRRPMDFWKGMVRFSYAESVCMIVHCLLTDPRAIPDIFCLSGLWRFRLRVLLFHFLHLLDFEKVPSRNRANSFCHWPTKEFLAMHGRHSVI